MPDLAVFLLACATSCALAVDLQVSPADEEMPPMMTPDEVDLTNPTLSALGLMSWFACPLAGRVTNKMVTLADGYTYDLKHVVASCHNSDTLKSPHYQRLTIPTSLAVAFVNLDLMDIAKNAESLAQSIIDGEVPAVVRRWTGSPLRQHIWICADGRSRLMTSFKQAFTVEQLGMFLALDNGEFCFRNIRLEQVVDEICRRVDCGRGDVERVRETSVRMDTAHVEPGAHQSLSTSNLLSPSPAAPSCRPSVASHHRQAIDASSGEMSNAIHSPTGIARSSSGGSPLANHPEPGVPVTPVWTDDAAATAWADIADAIPWPNPSEVQPAPTLPTAISSAWAATIAHTRSFERTFWDRERLHSSKRDNFYAALFWAYHYRTIFKPDDMELPPKPLNPGDLRGWQVSCHRFFKAAEDILVNAILEKRCNYSQGVGRVFRRVCRHARALRIPATQLGLVPKRRLTWSEAIADTFPWPSMSAMTPVPSLPGVMPSAWAATIAHTRSLEDPNLWDWQGITLNDWSAVSNALFWVRQYTTKWKPPGMSLPPKPASSDGFREWQASCYRFFKAAEDRIVKALLTKLGVVDDVDEGSAGINRGARYLRSRVVELGLPINTERKRQRMPDVVDPEGNPDKSRRK